MQVSPSLTSPLGQKHPGKQTPLYKMGGCGKRENLQRGAGRLTGADGGAILFAAVMEAIVVHKTFRAFCRCDKRYLVLKKRKYSRQRCMLLQSWRWIVG